MGLAAQFRRVAQWQSASKHTGEVAAFDSCPAYQDSRPEILCLAHCVPNPPDKGEKIRLYHTLRFLAPHYRIHLVCFARTEQELNQAMELRTLCETGYVEFLQSSVALLRGGASFLLGRCLNAAYFESSTMRRHIEELARRRTLKASFVYTAVMATYAPDGLPTVMDMVDVDSEKWLQYSESRFPGFLYRAEARRLRRLEVRCAEGVNCTVVTTANEERLLRAIVPGVRSRYVENGVDFDYFDGVSRSLPPELKGRRFVLFAGTMDYYPNIAAAEWFATKVLPRLRQIDRKLEFVIAGRNPSKGVRDLTACPGIHVTGNVPDMRPYLGAACASVAPLGLARGIQNKVLEALAMGREVFASTEVCRTFGDHLPRGVVRCESPDDYVDRLRDACQIAPACNLQIRDAARERFNWVNVAAIGQELRLQ